MNFKIHTQITEDRLILKFRGMLNFSAKEHFLQTLNQYEKSTHSLVIDLKELTLIDSAGIGMLALFVKRSQVVGRVREVQIVNPQGQVRDSLLQCNFSALTPVSDSDPAYSVFSKIPH